MRVVAVLLVLVSCTGCVDLLAPNVDPVIPRCKALASPDPAHRDAALRWLEVEFVEGEWIKYKHTRDAQARRVAEPCLLARTWPWPRS